MPTPFEYPPDAVVKPFTGKYGTCGGVLDGNLYERTPGEWKTWLLPCDTPLTCLRCIRIEDLERTGKKRW